MVAAEGNQLFTDVAAPFGSPLALLGAEVADHPLHLVTQGQTAVGVTALIRVLQALDAALDAQGLEVLECRKFKHSLYLENISETKTSHL